MLISLAIWHAAQCCRNASQISKQLKISTSRGSEALEDFTIIRHVRFSGIILVMGLANVNEVTMQPRLSLAEHISILIPGY